MRKETYEKLEVLAVKYKGYMRTAELLEEGVTNHQIANLVDEGKMEIVSTGIYWIPNNEIIKPENYKMIEASFINPNSVICAESACYYWGMVRREPISLTFATKMSDKTIMSMNFPASRHYFVDKHFYEDCQEVETDYGPMKVYSMDRSVCECIYLKDSIRKDTYEDIIASYVKNPEKDLDVLYKHAAYLKIEDKVKDEIRDTEHEETVEITRRRRGR